MVFILRCESGREGESGREKEGERERERERREERDKKRSNLNIVRIQFLWLSDLDRLVVKFDHLSVAKVIQKGIIRHRTINLLTSTDKYLFIVIGNLKCYFLLQLINL